MARSKNPSDSASTAEVYNVLRDLRDTSRLGLGGKREHRWCNGRRTRLATNMTGSNPDASKITHFRLIATLRSSDFSLD
jgi:hypothetical protein